MSDHLPYTVHRYESREAWLAARRTSIGASEAGVILGTSKYSSPFSIWANKTGLIPPDESNERQRWGLYMEGAIARWFAEETGFKVTDGGAYTVLRSKACPILTATLDRMIEPGPRGIQFPGIDGTIFYDPFPLELKNVDSLEAYDWKHEPPPQYQVQLQAQMAVTGAPVGCIAVCIGGNSGRWHPVLRNEQLIKRMLYRLQCWWQMHIVENTPPQPDETESTRCALRDMFTPPKQGKRIELPEEILPWVTQFDQATAIYQQAEKGRDEAANNIRLAMGDAEYAEIPQSMGGGGFTWKLNRGGKRPFLRVDKLPKDLSEVG